MTSNSSCCSCRSHGKTNISEDLLFSSLKAGKARFKRLQNQRFIPISKDTAAYDNLTSSGNYSGSFCESSHLKKCENRNKYSINFILYIRCKSVFYFNNFLKPDQSIPQAKRGSFGILVMTGLLTHRGRFISLKMKQFSN